MTPEKDVAGLLPSSELSDERIKELWVEHGLDECDPEGFARVIEAEVSQRMRMVSDALVQLDGLYAGLCDESPERPDWLRTALRVARGEQRGVIVNLAAPGAAIAAREQGTPETKESLESALYAFARFALVNPTEPLLHQLDRLIAYYGNSKFAGTLKKLARDAARPQRRNGVPAPLVFSGSSREEAPVASGEPTDAQIRKVINDARYAWSAWRGNDSEDSFVGSALRKLFASPSGAGLGGAVASSEAVTEDSLFGQQVWFDRKDVKRVISTILSACSIPKGPLDMRLKRLRVALASQPGCAVEGEAVHGNQPCPFCGNEVDPEGWLGIDPDGSNERRGPECSECGATTESVEAWNRRTASQDTALLDFMQRHRVAVIPEFEGPWDAEIYGEDESPNARGSGNTPREAIASARAALQVNSTEMSGGANG